MLATTHGEAIPTRCGSGALSKAFRCLVTLPRPLLRFDEAEHWCSASRRTSPSRTSFKVLLARRTPVIIRLQHFACYPRDASSSVFGCVCFSSGDGGCWAESAPVDFRIPVKRITKRLLYQCKDEVLVECWYGATQYSLISTALLEFDPFFAM